MAKKLSIKQLIQDNKDILFDILEKHNVDSFRVSFEGSGDSGQIEDIQLDEKILKKKVEGAMVSAGSTWNPVTKESTLNYEKDVDVRTLIEGICYDVLEDSFGGWEINDGSYGEFYFDVNKRKSNLTMSERVMDVNTNEYTL